MHGNCVALTWQLLVQAQQGSERAQQQEGPREDPVKVSHVGAPVRDGLTQSLQDSKPQPSRLTRSLSGIAAEAGSAVLASALREAAPMLQQPGASELVGHRSGPLDILAAAHQRLSQPSPFAQVATSYLRRRGAPEPLTGAMQAGRDEVDLAELRVSWAAGVAGGRQWSGRPGHRLRHGSGHHAGWVRSWILLSCGWAGQHFSQGWKLRSKGSQACSYLRQGNAWHTVVRVAAGHAGCKRWTGPLSYG